MQPPRMIICIAVVGRILSMQSTGSSPISSCICQRHEYPELTCVKAGDEAYLLEPGIALVLHPVHISGGTLVSTGGKHRH